MKQEFIDKWSSWWMFNVDSNKLTEAFREELDKLIVQELDEIVKRLSAHNIICSKNDFKIDSNLKKYSVICKWTESDGEKWDVVNKGHLCFQDAIDAKIEAQNAWEKTVADECKNI